MVIKIKKGGLKNVAKTKNTTNGTKSVAIRVKRNLNDGVFSFFIKEMHIEPRVNIQERMQNAFLLNGRE